MFYAGISPRRKAGTIAGKRAQRLAAAIIKVLRAAIAEGGTSLRDHVQPGGEIGYFVQKLAVYGRAGEACNQCGTSISHDDPVWPQHIFLPLPALGTALGQTSGERIDTLSGDVTARWLKMVQG